MILIVCEDLFFCNSCAKLFFFTKSCIRPSSFFSSFHVFLHLESTKSHPPINSINYSLVVHTEEKTNQSFDSFVSERRDLYITAQIEFFCHIPSFLKLDWRSFLFLKDFDRLLILSQISLCSNQDNGCFRFNLAKINQNPDREQQNSSHRRTSGTQLSSTFMNECLFTNENMTKNRSVPG